MRRSTLNCHSRGARVEGERLDRNPNLHRPAAVVRAVAASQMPSQLGLSSLAAGLDERVVARAGRVHREHVAGSSVEKRPEHDAHVILGAELSASRCLLKLTMPAGFRSSHSMPMTIVFVSASTRRRVGGAGG